jgi:hypothetical protein
MLWAVVQKGRIHKKALESCTKNTGSKGPCVEGFGIEYAPKLEVLGLGSLQSATGVERGRESDEPMLYIGDEPNT